MHFVTRSYQCRLTFSTMTVLLTTVSYNCAASHYDYAALHYLNQGVGDCWSSCQQQRLRHFILTRNDLKSNAATTSVMLTVHLKLVLFTGSQADYM